ncbi:MAG: transglycosylase family protein [Solirubrobacteraceae bacterium]
MSRLPRIPHAWLAAGAAAVLAVLVAAAVPALTSAAPSIGQLSSQLGQQHAHEQSLSASLSAVSRLVASLDRQITLVQTREAAVQGQLASDRSALASVRGSLTREQRLLARLHTRLGHARLLLSRQLLSNYEGDKPDVISVVLEARGFADLLDRVKFLHDAERQQQAIIGLTRILKAQAETSAHRLANLETTDRQVAQRELVRARALQGMNGLLQVKQSTLHQAQAVQQAALGATRGRVGQLQTALTQLEARQAAAERAAAQRAAAAQAAASTGAGAPPGSSSGPSGSSGSSGSSSGSSGSSSAPAAGPTLGPSGGWAIPYAIVLCESGGQDLPPNSAGASGYYQIIPSTWTGSGGSGPAAYLASKAEQDAVASRIWNGGAGAANWVCAGIVGIH